MKVGIILPHGVWNEFKGLQPEQAWKSLRDLACHAEELGFDSVWLSDHFTPVENVPDAIVLEAFTCLSALAACTSRIRLGSLVLCAPFRNPALTAKMICTLDAISGGRVELGIGSGWKEDEFRQYGYGFPETTERLAILADHLEVLCRMLGPGSADWQGRHACVVQAVNVPKPVQFPRLPIVVGGNGRNVTWRLAARYADELNLDGLMPDDVAAAMPVIASRCDEIGRDPSSLRVSVYAGPGLLSSPGAKRVQALRRYAEAGVSRVILDLVGTATEATRFLDVLADEVESAGYI